MAISSFNTYMAAPKQMVAFQKTASRTSIAAMWFSLFDLAGNPSVGTLNVGNTANGLVPTDALAGMPTLNAFSGANKGYISRVAFGSSVACRMKLYDRLFHAGAYAFNANTTLASQPSISSRVPNADYKGLQIWVECVTAMTGALSVAVTYTNQDGTAAKTTGTISVGALTLGRMVQLPLAAGDTGVQKIESVVGSVATVGTFNVLILREVWSGRVRLANDGDTHNLKETGLPEVFADSALQVMIAADSTATGIPELQIEVSNG
jgi:uncharacterized protein YunC (DUF1805 family)